VSGTSVIIIQGVSKWSCEAFPEYIREQVESFTLHVSSNMLKLENFINFNRNHEDTSTHDFIEVDPTNNTQNEDGPDAVPFRINFNNLVLNNDGTAELFGKKNFMAVGSISFCEGGLGLKF